MRQPDVVSDGVVAVVERLAVAIPVIAAGTGFAVALRFTGSAPVRATVPGSGRYG
ncbi:MAG: hypothetical protein ABI696_09830 [Rubrivivax sp.]